MIAVVIQLPSRHHDLVIKAIILRVARCAIRTGITHHCIVLEVMRPIVAPNIALFLQHYQQNLRVYTIFLRRLVNNFASRKHPLFFLAARTKVGLMRLWVLVIFRNTHEWRIVVLGIAACAQLLHILRARHIAINLLCAPHIASGVVRINKRVNFCRRHGVRIVKNRVVNNAARLKFRSAQRLCLALACHEGS